MLLVVVIPAEVLALQVAADSGASIVVLRESVEPHRVLPIFIGAPEALSIAIGLEQRTTDRPMTHDLLIESLRRAHSQVRRAEVVGLDEGTFLAELEIDVDGAIERVSARPSDAIAVAIRAGVPLFVDESVLDEAGVTMQTPDDGDNAADPDHIEAQVDEFRDFLEGLSAADFDTDDPA